MKRCLKRRRKKLPSTTDLLMFAHLNSRPLICSLFILLHARAEFSNSQYRTRYTGAKRVFCYPCLSFCYSQSLCVWIKIIWGWGGEGGEKGTRHIVNDLPEVELVLILFFPISVHPSLLILAIAFDEANEWRNRKTTFNIKRGNRWSISYLSHYVNWFS